MRILTVLSLIAFCFMPVISATAGEGRCCHPVVTGGDKPNNLSSLSSTTEGGNVSCERRYKET
jgi:hypothetical protein